MDSLSQIERSKNSYTIVWANNQTIYYATKLETFFIKRRGSFLSIFTNFRECFNALYMMSSAQEPMENALGEGEPNLAKDIEEWFEITSYRRNVNIKNARIGISLLRRWERTMAKTTIMKV